MCVFDSIVGYYLRCARKEQSISRIETTICLLFINFQLSIKLIECLKEKTICKNECKLSYLSACDDLIVC